MLQVLRTLDDEAYEKEGCGDDALLSGLSRREFTVSLSVISLDLLVEIRRYYWFLNRWDCHIEWKTAEMLHSCFLPFLLLLKVLVLSEVGKPIFASCGHEEQLCSLIALIQTFVMVVTSWNDSLKRICSSRMQISFSYRSPLILCIVSRNGFQLDTQVDLVYKQVGFSFQKNALFGLQGMELCKIVSVDLGFSKCFLKGSMSPAFQMLSLICRAQLVSIFQTKGPSFDLRVMLKGVSAPLICFP